MGSSWPLFHISHPLVKNDLIFGEPLKPIRVELAGRSALLGYPLVIARIHATIAMVVGSPGVWAVRTMICSTAAELAWGRPGRGSSLRCLRLVFLVPLSNIVPIPTKVTGEIHARCAREMHTTHYACCAWVRHTISQQCSRSLASQDMLLTGMATKQQLLA